MRKILSLITIAVMLAIATPSMATVKAKMPKLLCIDWGIWHQQLSFKALGTVYMDGQKVKTYAMHGSDSFLRPITGTAYIVPGTPILTISYNTTYYLGGTTDLNEGKYLVEFNLASNYGIGYWAYVFSDGYQTNGDDLVFPIDCQSAPLTGILYDAPADAPKAGNAGLSK